MECALLALLALAVMVVDATLRRAAAWRREVARMQAERVERDCEAYREGYEAGYRDGRGG